MIAALLRDLRVALRTALRAAAWHLARRDRRLSSAEVRAAYDQRLLDELSVAHHRPAPPTAHSEAPR